MRAPHARIILALAALAIAVGAVAAVAVSGSRGGRWVTDRDATLRLRLDEFRIEPGQIRVRAGRVRIVARNRGKLTHNVVLIRQGPDDDWNTPDAYLFRSKTMHPGERTSFSRTLRPGRYRLLCTISNHDNLGQWAWLDVRRRKD